LTAWSLSVIVMLAAAFLRLYQLDRLPPGVPIDEAVNIGAIYKIAAGWRPIFIPQGWGREPLFHYIATLLFVFIGHAQLALRLTAAFMGLALVAAIGVIAARTRGRGAGVWAMAFAAVTYGMVFISRFGVRGVAFALISTLTVVAFWRAIGSAHTQGMYRWFILTGLLLGLDFYTYQSSRLFPLLFVELGTWLWWRDRARFQAAWRGMILSFAIGLLIGAPLFAYLTTHPDAESSREFMIEPLTNLRQGNIGLLVESVRAALGAFSFDAGDWFTNIPGHPVFPVITGLLFYLGLIVCLVRWRDLHHVTLVVWLAIGLMPAMVTSGLHYFRLAGALVPGLAMPALGLIEVSEWATQRLARWRTFCANVVLVTALGALALTQSFIVTWRDYFQTWPYSPQVLDIYNANLAEVGRYLDRHTDVTTAVIASTSAEDLEPALFEVMLGRTDLNQRWFDASSAIVLPGGTATASYFFRADTPLRASLADYLTGVALEHKWPNGSPMFTVQQLDVSAARETTRTKSGWPLGQPAGVPVSFGGNVELIGYTAPQTSTTGSVLRVLSTWRVLKSVKPGPSAIFVHLIDATGNMAAQDDQLGFPRHSWHADDLFVQLARLDVSAAPPGQYTLQIGLYDKDTLERWPARDAMGRALGDHLILGSVTVQR
jgi:4-amino-4-deoxy-L-arabinose transferase-like glycosyltransferase